MESETPIHLSTSAELATFLDSNCHFWNTIYGRDLKEELRATVHSTELAQLLQWEQTALSFWFKDGQAQPEWTWTNNEGQTVGAPMVSALPPKALDYYQLRYNQSPNLYLKARYALILSSVPKPSPYARLASAAHAHLLAALALADCAGRKDRRDCTDLLATACDLALQMRPLQAATIAAVLDRFTGVIPFEKEGKTTLLRHIAHYAKLFKPAFITNEVSQGCETLFIDYFAAGNYSGCEYICKNARIIAQRCSLDQRIWYVRLGKTYEAQAVKRLSDDTSLVPIEFYRRAAEAYRSAGDEAALEKALLNIKALKPKLTLSTFDIEMDPDHTKALHDEVEKATQHVLAHDSDGIWSYLSASMEFIPPVASARQFSEQQGTSLMSIVSISYIDTNKNTRRPVSKGKKKEKENRGNEAVADDEITGLDHDAAHFYQLSVDVRLVLLRRILAGGYRAGKLTFETLCEFLEVRSWVTQPLTDYDISGNPIEYSWRPMLYPGFREFFQQLAILDKGEEPNFVLCLDSLTVKFEGLLRELLQQAGATTTAPGKQQDLREIFVEAMLDTAAAKAHFDEDIRYFFRYLFMDNGKNLRNNIAHCYYHRSAQYSLDKMILLLCALLRVAAFRFATVDESTPN
jgi:hypothetical protein